MNCCSTVCALDSRTEGCTTAAFDRAAMNNHVHVVMWLLSNRDEGGTDTALQWAISRGHTKVIDLTTDLSNLLSYCFLTVKLLLSLRLRLSVDHILIVIADTS